jgi:hypothetical protein
VATPVRTRPLVAVISRVPLFVEAIVAAFEGTTDTQAVSPDDVEARGLLRAFRPDAVVAENGVAELADSHIPCVRVDLNAQELAIRTDGSWRRLEVELSPEAIRNAIVASLYGGEVA